MKAGTDARKRFPLHLLFVLIVEILVLRLNVQILVACTQLQVCVTRCTDTCRPT